MLRLPGLIDRQPRRSHGSRGALTPAAVAPATRLSPTAEPADRGFSPRERALLQAAQAEGITDITEQAMLLAQCAHESDGFTRLEENLRYSARRLLAVFPQRFRSLHDAEEVVRGGTGAIAERIYGGRERLGNVHTGDGARFFGRGYIHLTGRTHYAAASQDLGLNLLAQPELAADPRHAARIAVWFWQRDRRTGMRARAGNVEGVTRIVNGGLNGLADRRLRFERYLRALRNESPPVAPPSEPPDRRIDLPIH